LKVYIIGMTSGTLLRDNGTMPGKASGSSFEERYLDRGDLGYGQELIEFAGRLCYESFDLPNEKTKENSGYIRNIVSLGHESVLEHASVTFYVEGVSRNLSHELIRHRHLSFSELSQRYVDMEEANFVVPPAYRSGLPSHLCPIGDYPSGLGPEGDPLTMYKEMTQQAEEDGKTRKQSREAARSYLPSGMETKFVVTGNLRAWRDVLKKRDSEHADAEMQLFAKEVKRQLLGEYPDVFRDLDAS